MALSFAVLTQGQSATNGSSFATASISPTADKPVFLCVTTQAVTSGNRQAPTSVTGAGMTWVLVGSIADATFHANSIWRAQSASPGSGALTINYGLTQDNCAWSVIEVTNAYGASSANGAEAVRAISTAQTANATSTSAAILCGNTQNGLLASHGWSNIVSGTPATATAASGWTEQAEQGIAESGFSVAHESQARASNDTAGAATWSATSGAGGTVSAIVVEIVGAKPRITAQPVEKTSSVGATATFSVTATASSGSLTYQWQKLTSGAWGDIGGATSSSYTTPTLVAGDNSNQYRVKVTDSNGTEESAAVFLFLTGQPVTGQGQQGSFLYWGNDIARMSGSLYAGTDLDALYRDFTYDGVGNRDIAAAWRDWWFPSAGGSPDVSLSLTGASATVSAGQLAGTISYTLSGTAGTFSAGTLTAAIGGDVSVNLTGAAATFSAGQIAESTAYTLSGASSTASAGTVRAAPSYALSGQAGTFSAGSLSSAIAYTLNGVAATFSAGIITQTGGSTGSDVTLSLTGASVTVSAGNVSSAIAYGLSGASVTASPGSLTETVAYGLTGAESVVSAGTITANVGGDVTRTLTGAPATFEAGNLTASGGDAAPSGGHGFEMGGDEPRPRKRRNLVYVVKDEPRSTASQSQKPITIAEARAQAEEIIKAAATEHAATRVSKDVRFGYVRSSLKEIQPALAGFDWVGMYKRAYDAALIEQIRIQEQIADQLEEDSAVAFLLLNM